MMKAFMFIFCWVLPFLFNQFLSTIQGWNENIWKLFWSTLFGNHNEFWTQSNLLSVKIQECVSKASNFRLNFCPFLSYKSKNFKATNSRSSKKLLKTIMKSCKKLYGLDFSYFLATLKGCSNTCIYVTL